MLKLVKVLDVEGLVYDAPASDLRTLRVLTVDYVLGGESPACPLRTHVAFVALDAGRLLGVWL